MFVLDCVAPLATSFALTGRCSTSQPWAGTALITLE